MSYRPPFLSQPALSLKMSYSSNSSSFVKLVAGMLGIVNAVEALAARPSVLEVLEVLVNEDDNSIVQSCRSSHRTSPLNNSRQLRYKRSKFHRAQTRVRTLASLSIIGRN